MLIGTCYVSCITSRAKGCTFQTALLLGSPAAVTKWEKAHISDGCAHKKNFDMYPFEHSNCRLSTSTIVCNQMEETLSREITAALLTDYHFEDIKWQILAHICTNRGASMFY